MTARASRTPASVYQHPEQVSDYRRAWIQAEQHAAYHLEAGRIHQDVLRGGMHVAPASLDRTRGLRRVHPGRIRNQINRLHRQLRRGYHGEPRVRAVLDAEALAGLALAPDLIVATVKVRACRIQQPFRLRELDLCEGTLA